MRSGQLNRLLQLQSVTMTADSEGNKVETWKVISTVWAAITPMTASEAQFVGQTEERITHQIAIRYRTDIGPRMRFLYGTRPFYIHRILNVEEANRELNCQCEEIVRAEVGIA